MKKNKNKNKNKNINVKETFLSLTSETYPNGTESELEHLLPKGIQKDGYGNYYLEIGDNYTTMFTSHLDTASVRSKHGKKQPIKHLFDGDGMIGTDGNTLLGADCKAGVTIMFNMIKNKVKGLYYFFLGEEVGCLGSRWLAKRMKNGREFKNNKIDKVISFDRKGTNSIITYQWNGRCSSNKFAEGLIKEFDKQGMEFKKDPTGVCTDSVQFQDFIPECTNISVGYYNEHTTREVQDIRFLEEISKAVVNINWESLPVDRDPSVTDYGDYGGWADYYDMPFDPDPEPKPRKTFHRDYITSIKHPHTGEDTDVYISLERIHFEKKIIKSILESWGVYNDNDKIDWDGNNLRISWDNGKTYDFMSRRDLSYSDNRLREIRTEDIKLLYKEEMLN